MLRVTHTGRAAAALLLAGAIGTLSSCTPDPEVVGPEFSGANEIFETYVAIGNSITAGYQSGGINDSTQQRSYARLLAAQMGTRFAYPSLTMPGCPPPIANFATQARVGGATAQPCALRASSGVTEVLNNVAVPGATLADPTATTTPASNTLTTLILGGRTQVQKALEADPTFVSIWIGNNDVLSPALSGLLTPTAGVTAGLPTLAQMQASYDQILTQLLAGQPDLRGVLIGVVDVALVPALVPAPFFATAGGQAFINQATGKTVTVDPTCAASTSLISLQILGPIRAFNAAAPTTPGTHPPVISCGAIPGLPAPVGNIFVLDATERATISARVTEFNAWLAAKATGSTPWAYYNPNTLLTMLRSQNQIFFNPASATAPFGNYISLDGFHPATQAHIEIVNPMIDAINAKFGTTIPKRT